MQRAEISAQPERLARNAEAPLAGDPWSEPLSGLSLEGMAIGEFGIVLKDFLRGLNSKLGQVANHIYGFLRSTFGWPRDKVTPDLPPLPHVELSAEDLKDFTTNHPE